MGEKRLTRWQVRGLVQVEEFRNNPSVSTAVNNKTCFYLGAFSVFINDSCERFGTVELNRGYRSFVIYRNTHFFHRISQGFVKVCAGNLPGPLPSVRELIRKLIIADLSVFYKFCSAFFLEFFFFYCIQKAGLFQGFHTAGEK